MVESNRTSLRILAGLLYDQSPAEDTDWWQILALAQRHNVLPLLFWSLRERGVTRDSMPAAVWRTLEHAYYVETGRGMLREWVLARIVGALAQAGVPVLLLKGAALACVVYPDPVLRPMSDLDLLVRREHLEQARRVLETLGCIHEPEPPQRFNPFNAEFTGDISFRCPVGNRYMAVELHWEVFPVGLFRRTTTCDVRSFWERAVPLQVGDVSVLALSPEDVLVNVCVHLSMHGFAHLLAYLDIIHITRAGQVDWDVFVERVRRGRVRVACYFPLWWAAAAWGVPVPDEVLRALRPDPVRTRLGRWMTMRGMVRRSDAGLAWEHAAQMLVVDRLWGLVRLLSWLLFPGPTWLRERYRLRRAWHAWAWMAVHPLVVLWEGLRSLVAVGRQLRLGPSSARRARVAAGAARSRERAR